MNKIFAKLGSILLNVPGNNEICTMHLLVISSTEMEIESFTKSNTQADILITGIGSPAVIYSLLKKIATTRYDLIIQAGIAGVFPDHDFKLGDVIVVEKDVFADLGIEEKRTFSTLFDAGFLLPNDAPYTNGWLVNNHDELKLLSLKKGTAITVNKISDDVFQTETFIQKFNPDIETMEGAALHYVCLRENISFLQLRSISNIVGERDKRKWQMKAAVANLNEALKSVVQNFQK